MGLKSTKSLDIRQLPRGGVHHQDCRNISHKSKEVPVLVLIYSEVEISYTNINPSLYGLLNSIGACTNNTKSVSVCGMLEPPQLIDDFTKEYGWCYYPGALRDDSGRIGAASFCSLCEALPITHVIHIRKGPKASKYITRVYEHLNTSDIPIWVFNIN